RVQGDAEALPGLEFVFAAVIAGAGRTAARESAVLAVVKADDPFALGFEIKIRECASMDRVAARK
ncbi:MAG: hypothetical protein LBB66_07235, partial [Desulfovibrio sp.]|nr:hypothetical protein [Desulfovibrio sp.]